MSDQLRKLRGVMGIGLAWGLVWAATFAAIAVAMVIVAPDQIDNDGPLRVGAIMGGVGLLSGLAFGVFLSLAERGSAMRNLSPARAAVGGILGAAVYPLLTGRMPEMIVTCALGAIVATVSIWIARKSEDSESKQLSSLRDLLVACVVRPIHDAVGPATDRSTTRTATAS